MSVRQSVLYICFDPIPSPKGASTHVTYFLRALSQRYTVTLMSAGQGSAPAGDTYAGARHLAVPLTQQNYLDRALEFREAVWDELETTPYDIVHFRTMWAAVPVAEEKKRQGFRVVAEVNGVESIELKYHYPALRSEPELLDKLRRQEQLAFETADILITPSQATRHYLVHRQVPEERIIVIPNGVDTTLFQPVAFPMEEKPPTLLYIGTLAPWQGLDLLLDALRRALPLHPMRLQILAPESNKWLKPINKLIRKLKVQEHVELLPSVPHDQVPAVIQAADICVAPLAPTERNTVQGCSPVKLFEYMACGKPIIASDLPVVREVLEHGETALLFNMKKSAHLADALVQLAGDHALRKRLGNNALRVVQERFTWQQAQDDLLDAYATHLHMGYCPGRATVCSQGCSEAEPLV
ncbi:MAG: glycosyltransferase family 4 protein [Armatimonadota bacterium]